MWENNKSESRLVVMYWYCLAICVVVLDQISKAVASSQLTFAEPQTVNSLLNWTLLHNTGASFSFLSTAGGWQRWLFCALSLVVSVVVVGWLARLPKKEKWQGLALALILGGAVGNLWDRLTLGYVVDFIQVHYHQYYFAVFNIADSAISIGAAILIVETLFSGRSSSKGKV